MTTLVFHVIYPLHISLYYTQSSTSREATCKKPVESVSRSGTVCAQKSCDKKGFFHSLSFKYKTIWETHSRNSIKLSRESIINVYTNRKLMLDTIYIYNTMLDII